MPLLFPVLCGGVISADGFLKRGAAVDSAQMKEFPALSLFLATNNKITLNLKEALEVVRNWTIQL